MEPVARGDGCILNGTKTWISNAGNADFFLTYGTLDKSLGMRGICAFIVDAGRARGSAYRPIKNKAGSRSQDTAQLFFEDLRVPAANRLLPEGEGYKSLMCGTESRPARLLGARDRADPGVPRCRGRVRERARSLRPADWALRTRAGQDRAHARRARDVRRAASRTPFRVAARPRGGARPEGSVDRQALHHRQALMRCAEDAYQTPARTAWPRSTRSGATSVTPRSCKYSSGANEMHEQIIGEWELGYRVPSSGARKKPGETP